MNRKNPHDEK